MKGVSTKLYGLLGAYESCTQNMKWFYGSAAHQTTDEEMVKPLEIE